MNLTTVKSRPWFFAAVLSGAFCLVTATLLFWNYLENRPGSKDEEGLLFSTELAGLREKLNETPQDEDLKNQIRAVDLKVRQSYFKGRDFSGRGKYLLFVGLALFVIAMKRVFVIEKKLPAPGLETEKKMSHVGHARRAVVVLGVALCGGLLALASSPVIELKLPDKETKVVVKKKAYPTQEEINKNWPRMFGPRGLGVSFYDNYIDKWDSETGEGILWKVEVPSPGYCSPVVWGDRIFLSGGTKEKKEVFCYSTQKGELLWRAEVKSVQGGAADIQVWDNLMYAASTVACDGIRVYSIFVDGDAAAFDVDGKKLWVKNMGAPDNAYGNATSLTFYKDRLLIQYDQGGYDDEKSSLFAIDGDTGNIVWRKMRPTAGAWTTPNIIDTGKEEQLITVSDPWVISYNPETGDEIWKADILGADVAPSPVYADGMVFVIQPYAALFAINAASKGEVIEEDMPWVVDCNAPDICTPVCKNGLIFLLTTMGTFTCYDTKTGKLVWEEELDVGFNASPCVVGDWLYLLSEEGTMFKVKAARTFAQAEKCELREEIKTSPAFLDGRIYIRGVKYLYCIGK